MDTDDNFSSSGNQLVFFGTGTTEIYSAILSKDGQLSPLKAYFAGDTPTWLCSNNDKSFLYAVNEDVGNVLSFSFDRETGDVNPINSVSNFGNLTCHAELDRSNKWLGVVNYGTGNYALHRVNSDGSVVESPTSEFWDDVVGGIAHPHQFFFTEDNRFVFVPDLGTDKIMQFEFDENNLESPMIPNRVQSSVSIAKGAGPRHLACTSALPNIMFGSNELDSTLNVYKYNGQSGTLSLVQTVSTLPPSFIGTNSTAEVVASRCGNYVYVSNRGNESIAKFRVHRTKEPDFLISDEVYVTFECVIPCGGSWPRFIGFDLTHNFMFATNQKSNDVAVFKFEKESGDLTLLYSIPMASPQHALFIPLH